MKKFYVAALCGAVCVGVLPLNIIGANATKYSVTRSGAAASTPASDIDSPAAAVKREPVINIVGPSDIADESGRNRPSPSSISPDPTGERPSSTTDSQSKLGNRYKLGTNAINTVAFGDISFNYEMPVFDDSAFLFGMHVNPDRFNCDYTGQYGAVVGYKLYEKVLDGYYAISLIGYNRTSKNSATKDVLSLEFWAGRTFLFGKSIYIDAGIGVGRKYDPDQKSEAAFLAGLNLGFYFPEKLFWIF